MPYWTARKKTVATDCNFARQNTFGPTRPSLQFITGRWRPISEPKIYFKKRGTAEREARVACSRPHQFLISAPARKSHRLPRLKQLCFTKALGRWTAASLFTQLPSLSTRCCTLALQPSLQLSSPQTLIAFVRCAGPFVSQLDIFNLHTHTHSTAQTIIISANNGNSFAVLPENNYRPRVLVLGPGISVLLVRILSWHLKGPFSLQTTVFGKNKYYMLCSQFRSDVEKACEKLPSLNIPFLSLFFHSLDCLNYCLTAQRRWRRARDWRQ